MSHFEPGQYAADLFGAWLVSMGVTVDLPSDAPYFGDPRSEYGLRVHIEPNSPQARRAVAYAHEVAMRTKRAEENRYYDTGEPVRPVYVVTADDAPQSFYIYFAANPFVSPGLGVGGVEAHPQKGEAVSPCEHAAHELVQAIQRGGARAVRLDEPGAYKVAVDPNSFGGLPFHVDPIRAEAQRLATHYKVNVSEEPVEVAWGSDYSVFSFTPAPASGYVSWGDVYTRGRFEGSSLDGAVYMSGGDETGSVPTRSPSLTERIMSGESRAYPRDYQATGRKKKAEIIAEWSRRLKADPRVERSPQFQADIERIYATGDQDLQFLINSMFDTAHPRSGSLCRVRIQEGKRKADAPTQAQPASGGILDVLALPFTWPLAFIRAQMMEARRGPPPPIRPPLPPLGVPLPPPIRPPLPPFRAPPPPFRGPPPAFAPRPAVRAALPILPPPPVLRPPPWAGGVFGGEARYGSMDSNGVYASDTINVVPTGCVNVGAFDASTLPTPDAIRSATGFGAPHVSTTGRIALGRFR